MLPMSLIKILARSYQWPHGLGASFMGVGIGGTLGDIDPLNKVPLKRATSEVQKGLL